MRGTRLEQELVVVYVVGRKAGSLLALIRQCQDTTFHGTDKFLHVAVVYCPAGILSPKLTKIIARALVCSAIEGTTQTEENKTQAHRETDTVHTKETQRKQNLTCFFYFFCVSLNNT